MLGNVILWGIFAVVVYVLSQRLSGEDDDAI